MRQDEKIVHIKSIHFTKTSRSSGLCSVIKVVGTPDFRPSTALRPLPCQRFHSRFALHIAGRVRPSAQVQRFLQGSGLTARLPHGFLANFAHDGGDGLVGLEVPCENMGRGGQHTVPKEACEILP